MKHVRTRPVFSDRISPQDSRTERCRRNVGKAIACGACRAETVAGACANASITALRVGSDMAEKQAFSLDVISRILSVMGNRWVLVNPSKMLAPAHAAGRLSHVQ